MPGRASGGAAVARLMGLDDGTTSIGRPVLKLSQLIGRLPRRPQQEGLPPDVVSRRRLRSSTALRPRPDGLGPIYDLRVKAGLPDAQEALRAAQKQSHADAVVRTAVRQALEGVEEATE